MDTGETLSIDLDPRLRTALQDAVERGEYTNLAELVLDALEDWRVKHDADNASDLRALVQAGIDSGPGVDGAEVFAALRARFVLPAH